MTTNAKPTASEQHEASRSSASNIQPMPDPYKVRESQGTNDKAAR